MFSVFKQASGTREVVLQDLSEDQLSEVAGGKHHQHHHKHHHHMPPTTTKPVTPTTTTGTGTTTIGGVTYPANSHW